ncbi:hypothetical protein INT46_007997 [Mucor plumbeus]|uniref:Uncharacterized protein n=1 Tax=Mucor plumbeus TaxID=97098 RepID=A0A8H7RLA7_9FUNG|nr:hypothetical protein INT46_007997 [Mucor plumbeus]
MGIIIRKRCTVSDYIDDLTPRATTAATNVSGKDFRNLVFKAGYNLLKNQFTISTAQELNIIASNLNPTSFGEHLDHLAHHLLRKNQTKEIEFALRLALSRIVYMVGGTAFHVQQQYFKERNLEALLEGAGNSKPSLESGLDANMIDVYTDFLSKVDDSSKEARMFLMQKRMEVLSGGGEDTDLMKMLDILDYMVADALLLPDIKASELTWYRKTVHILDILFRKSGVSLNELARNENKLLCDDNDDKKPVLGRKLDLLLNAASMNKSSSEWKKGGVCASLVEQQQIKNVRANSAILRQLHKLPIDEERKPNVYVLAIDWIGVCGYIFAVKEINEAHVAHHIGDLVLPASLSSFQDFQTTPDLLFSFRNYQLKLKKIVEPAYNRQNASNTLKSFRSVTPPPNEPSISPGTFFSPVKKQSKTSQSNITHPRPSDDIDDT